MVLRARRQPASLRSRPDEQGFSLLELVIALGLLAVVAGGFLMTAAAGFRAVALARQRQTAADVASARLEHLRSVPYSQVALSSVPVHSADAANPNSLVSENGLEYDVTGEGDTEPLITDTSGGAVLHLEDPVTIGRTVLEIYQYVTWVDDPSISGTQDYKRLTVVVRYKAVAQPGVSRIVRASSFFTPGTVTIPAATSSTTGSTTTTVGSTTTTAPSTTTTTSSCPGDNAAPVGSFALNGNASAEAGFTAAQNAVVQATLTDSCTPISVRLSNNGTDFGASYTYDVLNPTVSWALSNGDGMKQVWAEVRDAAGNQTVLGPQTIVLDSTLPTTPGTLSRSVTCAGTNRTVALTWSTSTDTNLRGYRIYRSTDGTTWSALTTTSGLTTSDTHKKNLDSVRYYAVAYDKAGNESNATNIVSLAKNQCS